MGVRRVPVGNYVVLYLPVDETHTVEIVRIMYQSRNITANLAEK